MTRRPGNGPNWSGIAAWVGISIALAGSGMTTATVYGEIKGQVSRNADDIKQMQADGRSSASDLKDINERTARMEEKLNFLLPTPALKPAEKR